MAETRVSDERITELLFMLEKYGQLPRRDTVGNVAALKELQELRAQSSWVKVSERLPENDPFVLVFVSNADGKLDPQFAVAYRYEGNWMGELDEYADDCVTHWMALPAPPEEDTNG